jgi:hypothetical protein
MDTLGLHRELDSKHLGETIFVIGSGPQLASLSQSTLAKLEKLTTIAVNKVFYQFRPTYFLSAYIGEVLLAAKRVPESTLLHMRPIYESPLVTGVIPLKRMQYENGMSIPRNFGDDSPTLLTRFNVALGATHLAYILGAKRIVYLGVEQRNRLHFYNFDEELRQKICSDLMELGDPEILRVDHPYASQANALAYMNLSIEECMQPFYSIDHTPTFRSYFEILAKNGVDLVATTKESVVADAGARVECLDEIIKDTGRE